jgi:tRNA (cytidine/uridine-2'-O-)-methyltransferase
MTPSAAKRRAQDGGAAEQSSIGTLAGQAQVRIATIPDWRISLSCNEAFPPAGLRQTGLAAGMMIALYQPDIAQNTGTILRLCACLGLPAHIIEPTGFPSTARSFRRAGMDYLDAVVLRRHVSWEAFEAWRLAERRNLVLFTTQAETSYLLHTYTPDDILLFGRESAGVPAAVHAAADS